jgi:hypothetical protein
VSAAHNDAVIEQTISIAKKAFGQLSK